jgi:hypothetical protein
MVSFPQASPPKPCAHLEVYYRMWNSQNTKERTPGYFCINFACNYIRAFTNFWLFVHSFSCCASAHRVMASSFLMFIDHTQRRATVGRNPLDEWSARRRDLYLTTHNTHNTQTSMPPVGFELTISAGGLPQTYALNTGTGDHLCIYEI